MRKQISETLRMMYEDYARVLHERETLKARRDELERAALALLKGEDVDEDAIEELLGDTPPG